MTPNVQKSFNWKVVLYLFFGGTGGGLFLVGFVLERLSLMVPLARVAEVLGPIFVLIGCGFLLLHAGSGFKTKIYLLFLKPEKSWISRGTWIIAIFVISAFIYTGLGRGAFWGWVAGIFSLLMAIYPGFLLAENKAVPLWSNSVLPTLFLVSGLSTAVAFLLMMGPLLGGAKDEAAMRGFRILAWMDVFIIVTQLVILWNFLGVKSDKGTTFSESLRLLKGPLFTVGTLLVGLLLPLVLHLFVVTGGKSMGLGTMTGILLITGGICLRFAIVRAGVYLPRHSL